MDVSSLVCNSKNQKLIEEQDAKGSSNGIGILPDRILRHILSLLPTIDAVGTSVLSKRWQYLWTSIPKLDFVQGSSAKRSLFMNFVGRVILLHDFSNLEKFYLSCDVLNDASRVNSWISTVVRHKVQQIYICLSNFEEPFMLPHCLFTSDSLTFLKVEMCCILKLPSSICFSSLKKLMLRGVTFLDDCSTQRLFSGCPVLEYLSIEGCNWENLKAVSISAPKLFDLAVDEYDYECELVGQSGSNGCQVMIFGTSLKSINYDGEFINDYCLCNASSLLTAHIRIVLEHDNKRQREIAYRANKLLRELTNVNELILSSGAVEIIQNYAEELVPHLPMFNNLTSLDLNGYLGVKRRAFLKILQNCPYLKSLRFAKVDLFGLVNRKDDLMLDPVPPCFLSQLETIQVTNFNGEENELFVIKILLKNAIVLKRMIIRCTLDYIWDSKKREKVHEQLSLFPCGSSSCSIVLHEGLEELPGISPIPEWHHYSLCEQAGISSMEFPAFMDRFAKYRWVDPHSWVWPPCEESEESEQSE